MRTFDWLLALTLVSQGALAMDVGVLRAGGHPITPSEEGRLVRMVARPSDAGTPTYTLVRQGGEAVLLMNAQGHVLTPTEAWEQFGGQRPASPRPARHPAESSFSVPNAPRVR